MTQILDTVTDWSLLQQVYFYLFI